MTQLTNLIPKTAKDCRELIEIIRSAEGDNITLVDRYGYPSTISRKEAGELVKLIESQIGEKVAAPKKTANTNNVKKNLKKQSVKK